MADDKLQTTPTQAMERPAFLSVDDVRGTEHLTKDDIQLPRIGLAQGLSPEIQDGDPKFISDLKVGMMFNNLTRQIIEPAKGPIEFTVIRAERPRYVEFIPRTAGGGIKDFDVPANDPRTQFTRDPVSGQSVPPVATKFYDFIIMMLPVTTPQEAMQKIIALSFKSTGLKVARNLNGLMKLRNAPTFAGKYTLKTGMDKNSKGTFAVFQIANAGWVDEPTYKIAEAAYKGLEGKTVVIEREPGEEDEFPTEDPAAVDSRM